MREDGADTHYMPKMAKLRLSSRMRRFEEPHAAL